MSCSNYGLFSLFSLVISFSDWNPDHGYETRLTLFLIFLMQCFVIMQSYKHIGDCVVHFFSPTAYHPQRSFQTIHMGLAPVT